MDSLKQTYVAESDLANGNSEFNVSVRFDDSRNAGVCSPHGGPPILDCAQDDMAQMLVGARRVAEPQRRFIDAMFPDCCIGP